MDLSLISTAEEGEKGDPGRSLPYRSAEGMSSTTRISNGSDSHRHMYYQPQRQPGQQWQQRQWQAPQMQAMWRPPRQPPQLTPEEQAHYDKFQCFTCGKIGHKWRQCRSGAGRGMRSTMAGATLGGRSAD